MNSKRLNLGLRRIAAVLAGLLAIFILSTVTDLALHATGFYPPWTEPMNDLHAFVATAYRLVFSIFGCYLAARIAPDRPMRHALALGIVGILISLAGAVATWNADLGPRWYALGLVIVSLPCAWLGGWLRVSQENARAVGGEI
ncbi:MAG TPA: hypothetical protein VN605_04165 [Thermoanaerobaculia bacterium]|nr:hypothetical protein [Thermoanaerobaculia bacterium]